MAIPSGDPVTTPAVADAVSEVVDKAIVDALINERVLDGFVRLLRIAPLAEAVTCTLDGKAVGVAEMETVPLATFVLLKEMDAVTLAGLALLTDVLREEVMLEGETVALPEGALVTVALAKKPLPMGRVAEVIVELADLEMSSGFNW